MESFRNSFMRECITLLEYINPRAKQFWNEEQAEIIVSMFEDRTVSLLVCKVGIYLLYIYPDEKENIEKFLRIFTETRFSIICASDAITRNESACLILDFEEDYLSCYSESILKNTKISFFRTRFDVLFSRLHDIEMQIMKGCASGKLKYNDICGEIYFSPLEVYRWAASRRNDLNDEFGKAIHELQGLHVEHPTPPLDAGAAKEWAEEIRTSAKKKNNGSAEDEAGRSATQAAYEHIILNLESIEHFNGRVYQSDFLEALKREADNGYHATKAKELWGEVIKKLGRQKIGKGRKPG